MSKQVLSDGEETLDRDLKCYKIPFVREFRFDPKRKWRVDFILPGRWAVEVEGGSWSNGRHSRGKGFASDCEKYNSLALQGYHLLRFTSEQVNSGYAIDTIQTALRQTKAASF